MKTQKDYIEMEERLGASNYRPLGVVLNRGQGEWVWDIDGNRYLDCLSAYSAVNQGHCHPRIKQAMIEQLDKLTLVSRAFHSDQLALFYDDLCKRTEDSSARKPIGISFALRRP